MPQPNVLVDDGGTVGAGTVLHTVCISRVSQWMSSEVFCVKDGEILQLWFDSYGQHQEREWRKLPSFEEASAKYHCTVVK